MRCLVVADLHYSLPQFDWLLSAASNFDLVIFAGDALDVGSYVDFRAQIVVVKKYLSLLAGVTRVMLCSGNHDLDERSPEGEKDLALDRRRPRTRRCLRRRQPDHRRHAVHRLPVVGWTAGQAADRGPAPRGRDRTAEAMGLGASRAAGEFADQLGRQALFRRRRSRAMDRAVSTVDGDLRPRASIAVHPRRLMVRSARRHLGVQCRPAARPPAGMHRARHRRRRGVLDIGGQRAMHRPQGAVAAAGGADHQSAGVAHILGSDCRSDFVSLGRPPANPG